MNKKHLCTSFVIATAIFYSGCGGGDNNASSTDNNLSVEEIADKIGIGYYVDSPIEGVEYSCGNQSGITDNNGTFTFEEGEACLFTLGEITLREVNASDLENNMILFEENLETSRLLQTLDNDGNSSNGIQIAQSVLESIKAGEFTQIPVTDDDLGAFFQELEGIEGYEGSLVSLQAAQEHLETTIKDLNLSIDLENYDFNEENLDNLDSELDNLLNTL